MFAGSASPPTEVVGGPATGERERVLERPAPLDRTIETLERISADLCVTSGGPGALCRAVVDAASHHFNARWAAMSFADGPRSHELPAVIRCSADGVASGWDDAPPALRALTARALAARGPVVAKSDDGHTEVGVGEPGGALAVAVPMLLRDELAGALAVGLPTHTQVKESDLSVLLTLANHAGLALHNAWMFQESERLREHAEDASRAAERHARELGRRSSQLERARRRLEEARRRQLLGQERNRIARELHDSVAQHLLSIGMMLEWCRMQEPTSSPILERLLASKELARSALSEIRAVIYELSSAEHPMDLWAALEELVEELTHTTDLEITLRTRGRRRALSPAADLALAQIAREALFNVARHAGATRGWLTVRYGDRSVGLIVADDGGGDAERLQRKLGRAARRGSTYHRGLANIAESARGLGAGIRFAARRGGGVRLEVTAPLEIPPTSERWEP